MKRTLIVAVVLVSVCAVALIAGCGGGQDDAATLTIWQTYNDEEYPVFKEIVESFKTAHPGITIDVVRLPFAGA